jgi:iron complex transport system ATP-binding protein
MAEVVNFSSVTVDRNGQPILDDVNWSVSANQRWAIIGPNGAGKTTLLRVAAAQIQPSSGEATVLGKLLGEVNVFELRTRIGFASNALTDHIPNSEKVLDAVMTASYGITGRWNEEYEELDIRRARRVLSEWGLGEFEDRAFGTLSDGEKKRVQIARSVMTDPELMLMDEPVASLDMAAREQTVQLLGEYAKSPTAPAMVVVTHHIEEIPEGFTHALLISKGKIHSHGPIQQVLTSEKISDCFGYEMTVLSNQGRYTARAKS